MEELEARVTLVIQAEAEVEHELVICDRSRCRMCGRMT